MFRNSESETVYTMHVLLSVELGETSPRQRTILRRELLDQGWKPAGEEWMFSAERHGVMTDEQLIDDVTDELHRALAAAEIQDWGADCFIKSKVGNGSDQRLTSH